MGEPSRSAELLHDIKSAAAAVRGAGEILRDDFPPEHPKAEFLQIMIRELERVHRLIERLLVDDQQPEGEATAELVDLCDLAREVAVLCTANAAQEGVRIVTACECSAVVRGEPERLKRLALNLLMNALEAAPPGTVVEVKVRLVEGMAGERSRKDVYLQVEDEGPGFSQQEALCLFEPHFTTKPGGTGLGLCVSQRIARSHGGELLARNRRGGGAIFVFSLPGAETVDGVDAMG